MRLLARTQTGCERARVHGGLSRTGLLASYPGGARRSPAGGTSGGPANALITGVLVQIVVVAVSGAVALPRPSARRRALSTPMVASSLPGRALPDHRSCRGEASDVAALPVACPDPMDADSTSARRSSSPSMQGGGAWTDVQMAPLANGQQDLRRQVVWKVFGKMNGDRSSSAGDRRQTSLEIGRDGSLLCRSSGTSRGGKASPRRRTGTARAIALRPNEEGCQATAHADAATAAAISSFSEDRWRLRSARTSGAAGSSSVSMR